MVWLNGCMSLSTAFSTTGSFADRAQILGRLETLEQEQRARDAERMSLLAAALTDALKPRAPEVPGPPHAPKDGGGPERAQPRDTHAERELQIRSLRAEIAATLQQSERQVEGDLATARALATQFTRTHTALQAGEIGLGHAAVITAAASMIGTDEDPDTTAQRATYETAILAEARQATPSRLRPLATRIATQVSPRSHAEQHRVARGLRSVRLIDRAHGMADLIAHLPLVEAHAIHDRLTRIAKLAHTGTRTDSPRKGQATGASRDARTLEQTRVDALIDLLLAASPTTLTAGTPEEAVQARIHLVVPASSTKPEGSLPPPAEVAGHGTIDMVTATRFLLHTDWWERVTTTSIGDISSIDRYRPSAALRRFLRVRDLHCRFPGCRVPVHRCDLDHTVAFAKGGSTSRENLAHLCRGHHSVKHHGDWHSTQQSNGTLTWVTPTRREYSEPPPSRVRFARLPRGQAIPEPKREPPVAPTDA